MEEIFAQNRSLIIFLHVISGVVWVGGMIAMRYAAHQSFMLIADPKQRLEHIAYALKRLFSIVLPFVVLLFVTAFFMIKGYSLHKIDLNLLAFAKEGIWVVMLLNLLLMIKRRNSAFEALQAGEVAVAKGYLEPIGKFMVPLNITLGVVAILLGSIFSTSL
ncbi:MAG: hypothetical protein WCR69_00565 [Sulfuricurvum sp.]|jgi:uncharacterized membrane protein